MSRSTFDEFFIRAKNVHGDTFSYEKVKYFNVNTKIEIVCHKHGSFYQTPKNHISHKQGCPDCFGNKKLTTKEFINKSIQKHGDLYDYTISMYFGNKVKVLIGCKIHGLFKQAATRHLSGDGCPKCGGSMKLSTIEFINKSNIVHNGIYDYSLVEYKNNKTKVKIICKKHGVFEMKPAAHLKKQSCKACSIDARILSNEKFIEKAKLIHGELYDYSKSSYKHNNIPTIFICKRHGEFLQKPNSHLNGRGCAKCKTSKGELIIMNFLNKKNIYYEYQKAFDGCINKRKLKFDFYIPNRNLIIEFDGDQHSKESLFFGGKKGFDYRKRNDQIKNKYALDNNMKLLRIDYNQYRNNKIKMILENNFN